MLTNRGNGQLKKEDSAPSTWSPRHSSKEPRKNLTNLISLVWFVISVYPVFKYLTTSPKSLTSLSSSRAVGAQATVTETVAVPALSQTALPNALSETTFNPARVADAIDTFRHYKQSEGCSLSSLDLHGPFEPLCQDRNSLLTAMSEGGRIGFDAPFSPRGCDMRWFSNDEICEILTRFEKIFIIGDSMMRNVAVALHVILRADLVDGGRTNWAEHPDQVDCSCSGPFDTSKCSFFSVVSTRVAWREDPSSVTCSPLGRGGFEYNAMLQYPVLDEDIEDFTRHLPESKPSKPFAFVMGHGLWNDLEVEMTKAWIDQVIAAIESKAPYLKGEGSYFPKVFLGPNAAGIRKPEIFLARQGNIALTKFEHEVGPYARRQGFDFIGTYNATIQSNNPDGTHGGMKNNLIKAMMVFNWLNSLDVVNYY